MSNKDFYYNYEKVTVAGSIGQGWRFYRNIYKDVLFYSVISNLLLVISITIASIPSTYISNVEAYSNTIGCFCGSGFILFILGYFLLIMLSFPIIKAFCNHITGRTLTFKETFNYFRTKLTSIFILSLIISIELLVFSIIDLILVLIISIPFVILLVMFFNTLNAFYVYTNVVFILFFFLVSWHFLIFELKAIIFVFDDLSISKTVLKFFKVYKQYFIKSFSMMFLLATIWLVLVIVFNLPFVIYMNFQALVYGVGLTKDISMLEVIITNVWNYLVNVMVWPFILGAIVMFYYSIKVESEGIDLKFNVKK